MARCVIPIRKPSSLWLQPSTARARRILAAKAWRSSLNSSVKSRGGPATRIVINRHTASFYADVPPAVFPPGAVGCQTATRSRIEVAMHAEAELEVVLVVHTQ